MHIVEIIKKIIHDEFAEIYGVPCSVKSVDTGANTCVCSPINGDADFIDVRLQADPGNSYLTIPTVGSKVIVQPINNATGYVSMYSSVESIKFLDGSYGGLVKVIDLVSKINGIENKVNTILATLKTHTHPVSGSVTTPSLDFAAILDLSNTVRADIENTKITHGNV